MDPATIVSTVAASAQFADQALKITLFIYATISKLTNASKVQRERSKRIEQLTFLLRAVKQHKPFQTDLVATEVFQCFQDLTRLRNTIVKLETPETASRWKRYPKRLLALLKDSEINELFNILERDKNSLGLALQTADSELLSRTGIKITSIHGQVTNTSVAIEDIADSVQETSIIMPVVLQKLEGIDASLSELRFSTSEEPFVNFPMTQTMDFIGRTDVLATMRRHLSDTANSKTPCIVLKGLPGQGKTALAIEYCRQTVQDTYQAILWIDSSTQDAVDNEFLDISAQILHKQPSVPTTTKGKASAVFRKLSADKIPWLVVFDGFNSFRNVPRFQDYLPTSPNASIIITTRRQDVTDRTFAAYEIDVDCMSEEDAINLLEQASHLDKTKHRNEEDRLAACSIIDGCWKNPLAIVQAGVYIQRSKLTFAAFSDIRCDREKSIMEETWIIDYLANVDGSGMPNAISLFTAWDLTLSQFQNEESGPNAHKDDLLKLFAFLPHKRFSERYLASFCSIMKPWGTLDEMTKDPGSFLALRLQGWNSREFCNILAELYNLGLLKKYECAKDGFYTGEVHDMVQSFLRLRIPTEARKQYKQIVRDIMLHSEPAPNLLLSGEVHFDNQDDPMDQLIQSWNVPVWEDQVAGFLVDDFNTSNQEQGLTPSVRDIQATTNNLILELSSFRTSVRDARSFKSLRIAIVRYAETFCVALREFFTSQETLEWLTKVESAKPKDHVTWLRELNKEWSAQSRDVLDEIEFRFLLIIKRTGMYSPHSLLYTRHLGQILLLTSKAKDRQRGIQLLREVYLSVRFQTKFPSDDHLQHLYELLWGTYMCEDWEAVEVLARYLIRHSTDHAGNELVAKSMTYLGDSLYFMPDRTEEAVKVLEAASQMCDAAIGDLSYHKLFSDARLARALSFTREPKRGLSIATETLRIFRENRESIDPDIEWQCLAARSQCQNRVGLRDDAIQSKREECAIRKASGRLPYNYFAELGVLVQLLAGNGHVEEAKTKADEMIHGLFDLGYPETNTHIQFAYSIHRQLDKDDYNEKTVKGIKRM